MNLNEVKKHIIFHLLIYIGIGLCFLLSIIVILATPTKAMEQTTDITSTIKTNYDCPWGYGANGYCAINTNNTGGVRSFNTRYNGVLSSISFAFPYYFNANSSSSQVIDIYSTTNDFRNNGINVFCYSYENSPSQSNVVNCGFRFISKKHIQVVYPYDALQWHEVIITGNQVTGDSNYLIQKVTLTYDDGQQDLGGIIENATSNTTDIINNSNSNTNDIINAINNGMTDLCTNMFNYVDYYQLNGITNFNPTPNNLILSTSSSWANVIYRFPVENGKTYYFNGSYTSVTVDSIFLSMSYNGSSASDIVNNRFWNYEGTQAQVGPVESGNWSTSFTSDRNGYVYLGIWVTKGNSSNTASYFQMTFNSDNSPFCAFGSQLSKLDKTNQELEDVKRFLQEQGWTIDDTNAYLKDDTNPNVPTSDIENTLDLVEINNPLGYLLTLPLSLIQKINNALSQNCSDFTLGRFGTIGNNNLGTYEFKFPCLNPERHLGSTLWGVIDTLVAIGLLAITIYKIYQGVINILTLGGEQEVSGQFVYWTPMEFLAIICGGDSVAVFQRRASK